MNSEENTGAAGRLRWRKSSYSGPEGGDCIEVATTPRTVHVRDSKDVEGPVLRFSAEEWSAFVSYAREFPATGV